MLLYNVINDSNNIYCPQFNGKYHLDKILSNLQRFLCPYNRLRKPTSMTSQIYAPYFFAQQTIASAMDKYSDLGYVAFQLKHYPKYSLGTLLWQSIVEIKTFVWSCYSWT